MCKTTMGEHHILEYVAVAFHSWYHREAPHALRHRLPEALGAVLPSERTPTPRPSRDFVCAMGPPPLTGLCTRSAPAVARQLRPPWRPPPRLQLPVPPPSPPPVGASSAQPALRAPRQRKESESTRGLTFAQPLSLRAQGILGFVADGRTGSLRARFSVSEADLLLQGPPCLLLDRVVLPAQVSTR